MLLTAKWVLPISSRPVENGAVAVDGDKIIEVGEFEHLRKKRPDEEILDFGLAAILPGFIDLHTHLEYSVFRGACDDLGYEAWKIQLTGKSSPLTADDWRHSARLGALEAIRSGITTIVDITNSGASVHAAREAGLRALVFYEVLGMDHAKVESIMRKAEKTLGDWRAKADSRISFGIAPHSPYTVSPPLFLAASRFARDNNFILCTHLAGSKAEYDFVKYGSGAFATIYRDLVGWNHLLWQPTGASPVKYLEQWEVFDYGPVLAVHCIHLDAADIDILEKYGVAVAHCPGCAAKLAMGVAPLAEFMERGLRIGMGTDSPASNNTMDVFDEMRIGLLLQRATNTTVDNLSAENFVQMATVGGAEAIGLDGSVGSLEPGKTADVIAVDLSHSHQVPARDPYSALVYTANQDNVVFTMIDGRVVYRDGEHLTLDEKEILRLVEPLRRKLL
ncbi:MAG: amidohydrolase family protein [Actinobacteria bacterium]|nr:amidohydrolase family protein [Actinomycetota bacterium]